MTAFCFCWLANLRIPAIDFGVSEQLTAIATRVIDGLAVGLILVVGLVSARAVIELFGVGSALAFPPGFDPAFLHNQFVFGFALGALIVPELRVADHMLAPPRSDAPVLTIESELAQIASRFNPPTADIVALTMELPWSAEAAPSTR